MMLDMVRIETTLMEANPQKYSEDQRTDAVKPDGDVEILVNDHLVYKRKTLCKSLSGLPMPVITITASRNTGKPYRKREAILVTSRVHPGESNASFVFQGIFDMLTKVNDPNVQFLRENFIFKIIPCLNPDGVVRGNYRSSFAGVDLNRQWICPDDTIHPEIYHVKQEIEKTY